MNSFTAGESSTRKENENESENPGLPHGTWVSEPPINEVERIGVETHPIERSSTIQRVPNETERSVEVAEDGDGDESGDDEERDPAARRPSFRHSAGEGEEGEERNENELEGEINSISIPPSNAIGAARGGEGLDKPLKTKRVLMGDDNEIRRQMEASARRGDEEAGATVNPDVEDGGREGREGTKKRKCWEMCTIL
ncbi:hypothetical protein BU16DRAFT_554353 [Lophium mytilinum]|uniref:Uncharacterized protein n=1 Tax=Lophium mytilinum TaxID=390894 RepID=A0A6A6RD26_9PEZI|nr:hypothetical protein BU16DRAFT_554353 [Lophium mytilinum]